MWKMTDHIPFHNPLMVSVLPVSGLLVSNADPDCIRLATFSRLLSTGRPDPAFQRTFIVQFQAFIFLISAFDRISVWTRAN